jgi:hypothetical protein
MQVCQLHAALMQTTCCTFAHPHTFYTKRPAARGPCTFTHKTRYIPHPRWLVKPGQLKADRHQNYLGTCLHKGPSKAQLFSLASPDRNQVSQGIRNPSTPQQTDTATGKADCRQHMCCFRRLSYQRTTPTVGVPVTRHAQGHPPHSARSHMQGWDQLIWRIFNNCRSEVGMDNSQTKRACKKQG